MFHIQITLILIPAYLSVTHFKNMNQSTQTPGSQLNPYVAPDLLTPNQNKIQLDPRNRQLVTQGAQYQDCDCAVNFRCPTCGPFGYEGGLNACPCMPQPSCPNCIMGKLLKQYHEKSAILAKRDKITQTKLANESQVEKKLFEEAQKYAQGAAEEEKLAKEAAINLQDHANKAALLRAKMIRAESQARGVAVKTLQTMSEATSTILKQGEPQFQINQSGTRHVAITQSVPEYQIAFNVGQGDGYLDAINQEIYNHSAIGVNNQNILQGQPAIPNQLSHLVEGPNYVNGKPM